MGLLLWMSHPAWPSLVWQTYDYFFEPTAAYFGCRKACEPLHIQWNALTDSIEVVNYSSREGAGLTATMEVLDLHGAVRAKTSARVEAREDTVVRCFRADLPADLTSVYFLRLRLEGKGGTVSENFYWRGKEEGNLQALRSLARVKLLAETRAALAGGKWTITTTLANTTDTPALMVRLKVVGEKSGERILPVVFGDNYVSLMPGERRTITAEVREADAAGELPVVALEGFNIR
jgi:hypothetical protein